jgi:hypothetical protein
MAIQAISHSSFWPLLPRVEKTDDVRAQLIKEVALATLKEIAISFAIVGICCLFVATPAGVGFLLTTTAAMVGFNFFIRILGGYTAYKLIHAEDEKQKLKYGSTLTFLSYICPLTYSMVDVYSRNVLVHEAGHALAAMACYKNANPKVVILPPDGGYTQYQEGPLTRFGQTIGSRASNVLVSGAGAGLALFSSVVQISASHKLEKSHPALSKYLFFSAIFSIVQHITYALTALVTSPENLSHDFVSLWLGGIHPIAAVAFMIVVPIIIKIILYMIDSYKERGVKPLGPLPITC